MNNTQIWQFDPSYTTVEFAINRLWFLTVKGRFECIRGEILLDDTDISRSAVTAVIEADSLTTGNKSRDAQLRSAAFLDVENYPEIQFSSTGVARGKDRDMLDLRGSLTVKGNKRDLFLSVSEMDRSRSPQGEEFVYYSATTEFDRNSLGLKSTPFIGNLLKVTINVQAIRQDRD
jgi:polyisoprenoid-binding protein YceI